MDQVASLQSGGIGHPNRFSPVILSSPSSLVQRKALLNGHGNVSNKDAVFIFFYKTRGIFLTWPQNNSITFTSLPGEQFSGVNKYKECDVRVGLHSSAVS